jgi:hypothetical protein
MFYILILFNKAFHPTNAHQPAPNAFALSNPIWDPSATSLPDSETTLAALGGFDKTWKEKKNAV